MAKRTQNVTREDIHTGISNLRVDSKWSDVLNFRFCNNRTRLVPPIINILQEYGMFHTLIKGPNNHHYVIGKKKSFLLRDFCGELKQAPLWQLKHKFVGDRSSRDSKDYQLVARGQYTGTTPKVIRFTLVEEEAPVIRDTIDINIVFVDALTGFRLDGVTTTYESDAGSVTNVLDSDTTISIKPNTNLISALTDYSTTTTAVGNNITNIVVTLAPIVQGALLVTSMQWLNEPSDLDFHCVLYNRTGTKLEHVYYSNLNSAHIQLDLDDTNYEGPETLTLQNFDGVFKLFIQDYTNRSATNSNILANSGCQVSLFNTNPTTTRNVPNVPGTLWEVGSIDGLTGVFTPSDVVTYHSDPTTVGS